MTNTTLSSASRGIAASWLNPATRARRSARHAVVVDGAQRFRSVPAAFTALGIPLTKAIPFRGALVQHGALQFSGHHFEVTL